MSPKTFSMAKTAICQVDDAVVSRLSRDTLLNLFPSPPQAPLKSRTTCATCPTAPPTPNTRPVQAPPKYRSRKAGRNRNWVITSGLFLTPPTVDEQEFHFGTSPGMSRASDATLRWSTMKHGLAAPALYPPRHPLSPCSPVSALETLVERQDQDRVVNKQMASGSINKHPASSRKPSTSAPSPVSPLEHLDELSQHLLNIETQLRRPSFLMNGRMSILSTLFTSASEASAVEKHDSRERLLAELSLAVGSVDMPSPSEASIFVIEPVIDTIEQAPCESEEEEMDWRAWHDAWRRRRMKPEHESPSSSTTSLPVPSYSSPNSKSCSPKDSTNNSSAGFLRRRKGKSQDAMGMLTPKPTLKSRKFFSVHSSPSSATPSEGSSTASAEGDNMKWGDRFQMLVQNFQFTAEAKIVGGRTSEN
ncbi:hypothetical protein BGZ54_008281 [Gamsiella multidivaricata]|nr:hypothetical protein BGZ54_008281 [Gamsiella multidivaricata]